MLSTIAIPLLLVAPLSSAAQPFRSITAESSSYAVRESSDPPNESGHTGYHSRGRSNLSRRVRESGSRLFSAAAYISIFALIFITFKCVIYISSGSHLLGKRRLAEGGGGQCNSLPHPAGFKRFEELTPQEKLNLESNLKATIENYNKFGNMFSDGYRWRIRYDDFSEVWETDAEDGCVIVRRYDYKTRRITEYVYDKVLISKRSLGGIKGIEKWLYETPPPPREYEEEWL